MKPRTFLALVVLSLTITTNAQAPNPLYLREMPSEEKVVREIQGSDPIDTIARQAGTLTNCVRFFRTWPVLKIGVQAISYLMRKRFRIIMRFLLRAHGNACTQRRVTTASEDFSLRATQRTRTSKRNYWRSSLRLTSEMFMRRPCNS